MEDIHDICVDVKPLVFQVRVAKEEGDVVWKEFRSTAKNKVVREMYVMKEPRERCRNERPMRWNRFKTHKGMEVAK